MLLAVVVTEPVVLRRLPRVTLARVAWVVVGLALVAGLGVLGWFWRHPTALPEAGGWGYAHHSWPVGKPIYAAMTFPDLHAGGSITVRSASAHVVEDSADAEIAFFVCTLDTASNHPAVGIEGEKLTRADCSSLDPVSDQEMHLGNADDPRQQVVMAITLRHHGGVIVDGADLTYADGLQEGTQRIGGHVEIAGRGG